MCIGMVATPDVFQSYYFRTRGCSDHGLPALAVYGRVPKSERIGPLENPIDGPIAVRHDQVDSRRPRVEIRGVGFVKAGAPPESVVLGVAVGVQVRSDEAAQCVKSHAVDREQFDEPEEECRRQHCEP
mmetsp:Transcript_22862/g.48630  ORF Transcript_22862/g.48630 Transcript_22862/m.48630 type:complete len:128 (+) Transcript_22862:1032-1415(+)